MIYDNWKVDKVDDEGYSITIEPLIISGKNRIKKYKCKKCGLELSYKYNNKRKTGLCRRCNSSLQLKKANVKWREIQSKRKMEKLNGGN